MKVLVAPDSFKGSLDAYEAASAIREGLLEGDPTLQVRVQPISDGGEGLTAVLTDALGGTTVGVTVTGPTGHPVEAHFGWLPETHTAIVEVAQACGLPLVPIPDRHPLHLTSYGVGQLLEAARNHGATHIIVGVGGSATVDGGLGAAIALGADVLDKRGNPIGPTPDAAQNAQTVEWDAGGWEGCEVIVASDVSNRLLGPEGAAAVFGPQKGATPDEVALLEAALQHWAELVSVATGVDVSKIEGSGAAGGIPVPLVALLDAKIVRGIDLVIDHLRLRDPLSEVDIAITGEGQIDGQTTLGKAPWGIRAAAAVVGKPTLALCGRLGRGGGELEGPSGFTKIEVITPPGATPEQALSNAAANLRYTARRIARDLPNLVARAKVL